MSFLDASDPDGGPDCNGVPPTHRVPSRTQTTNHDASRPTPHVRSQQWIARWLPSLAALLVVQLGVALGGLTLRAGFLITNELTTSCGFSTICLWRLSTRRRDSEPEPHDWLNHLFQRHSAPRGSLYAIISSASGSLPCAETLLFTHLNSFLALWVALCKGLPCCSGCDEKGLSNKTGLAAPL